MLQRAVPVGQLILAALIAAALASCSKQPAPASTGGGAKPPPPFATSAVSENYSKDDPCSLLDPKEVEAVLGAPLAVPPYRAGAAGNPSGDGSRCVYETAKFRYLTLEVTWEGGQQTYSMAGMVKNVMKTRGTADINNNVKKNFKLDDGTELAGEWDEATLMPMNCCIFLAMRGDQMLTIDFTASPATLTQAATLVDAAYKRMDQRLPIDGSAAVNAAKALDKTRPQQLSACSVLTRAEVEAILGPLASDPTPAGDSVCRYDLPPRNNTPQQYELSFRWRGGYYQWRSDHHAASIGHAAVKQMVTDIKGGHEIKEMSNGEADASAAAGVDNPQSAGDPAEGIDRGPIGGFRSVRKDVLVGVNGMFIDPEKEKALLMAVLQKI